MLVIVLTRTVLDFQLTEIDTSGMLDIDSINTALRPASVLALSNCPLAAYTANRISVLHPMLPVKQSLTCCLCWRRLTCRTS